MYNKISDERLKDIFNIFVNTLQRRLVVKENIGVSGWDDAWQYTDEEFKMRMARKLFKKRPTAKDYIDIANYALFLWARK